MAIEQPPIRMKLCLQTNFKVHLVVVWGLYYKTLLLLLAIRRPVNCEDILTENM